MQHITVGRKYNEGKVAKIECVRNDRLQNTHIKNNCFLLIILTAGKLEFKVENEQFYAAAPAFICFDETADPVLISKQKAQYTCIYFHPEFLNVNMSFEMLRKKEYVDIASTHDLFLLKPFTNKAYVVPIAEAQLEKITQAARDMQEELQNQRDWYWSCRGRSYFMEIIIALERMYGLIGYGVTHQKSDNTPIIKNAKLRDAVLYIESRFDESITQPDIAKAAGMNHTTLTALMKEELGLTAIEYLMKYRITVAKKQLEFTSVPIKDIANMTGFKTVQHFSRVFKSHTGTTPAEFRKNAVQKRKDDFK
ncbi:MAG: helix-turn-helix domain-containing protein [Oscillospiraceae bacterium]